MRNWLFVFVMAAATLFATTAPASADCRVGEEVCQQGHVYRCEYLAAGVSGLIQTTRTCVVDTRTLNGTWRGVGRQTPAGATASSWTILMVINDNSATIEYPSLGCGGTLTQLSRTATTIVYREQLTHGNDICVDGEIIAVNLSGGSLGWRADGNAGDEHYVATATLTR